jgi:hypothetical protein
MLPFYINIESDNPKKFKLILQKFLYKNFFHSADEYFELKLLFIYDLRPILKYSTGNKQLCLTIYLILYPYIRITN